MTPLSAEDLIANLFHKYEVFLSADMFDEIHQIIKQASQEAYERGKAERWLMQATIADARNSALEEAAKVAEEYEDVNTQDYYGEEIALAIRALKSEGKP